MPTIERFWSLWAHQRDAVIDAIDGGRTEDPALHAVLQAASVLGLACEFGPGLRARHALCVSADGDPAKRKLAYRWYEAAPPEDGAFEFHPARIAAPAPEDMVLRLVDEDFGFADFRFDVSVDEDRLELGLVVAHPAFPRLDDDTRAQVGFLGLDNILGEEEVERWIGELEWSERPPDGGIDAHALRAVVDRLAATAPSGEWAVLRGEDAIAVAARPLRPVDHPYFDELCELTAPVGELSELQDHEEELAAHFGARAFHAASLTREGERTAFVYVDRDESTSTELAAWASARGYAFHCAHDPAWDAIRPFR
jgi:hypothetical protein